MKRIWIVCAMICLLLCGCGKSETPSQVPGSESATPQAHVVHISSGESSAEEKGQKQDGTAIDWQAVLSLTAEYMPDMEALKTVLPEPVEILHYSAGDLWMDGTSDDYVIVYEYPSGDGEDILYRALAVFTAREAYECLAFHETLLLDDVAGGTPGDPYQYAEIEDNGELHITFCGGSSWQWGYDLWFEPVDTMFVMYRLVETYSYIHTGDTVSLIHNFREQQTTCDAYWYTEDLNYALLYEYDWPEEVAPLTFAEVSGRGEFGQSRVPVMDAPLPIFDTFYAHEDMRSRFADFNTESMLDAVKDVNYPDMEKVMYDTNVLYLDEISAFMGYEMPRYYYENAEGVRLYYRTASFDSDNGWTHEICLAGDGVYDTIFHRE